MQNNGYNIFAVITLGDIGSPGAIPFLTTYWEKFKNTLNGAAILNYLGKIGQMTSLPILIQAFLDWDGERKNIIGNSVSEGEDVSTLFPYRELDALRYFGRGIREELKKNLNTQDSVKKVRAACALAVLDSINSLEYEEIMTEALKRNDLSSQEALFSLRCFNRICSDDCIMAVVEASCCNDAEMRLLACKVVEGNCAPEDIVRAKKIYNWIDQSKKATDRDILRERPSIWDEIYYCWMP